MTRTNWRNLITCLIATVSLTLAMSPMAAGQSQDPPEQGGPAQADNRGRSQDDRGNRPQRGQDDDEQDEAEDDEQEGEGRPDRPDAERGPGQEAGQAVRDSGLDPSSEEARVLRRVMLEEAKFRRRMGKINRLRELATEQGNKERLEALDTLEAKMREIHERKIARAKEQIGRGKAKALEDRVKQGRGKGRPDEAGARGQGGRPDDAARGGRPDDAGRGGRPDDAGRGGKPDETGGRPANTGGGKPDRGGGGKPDDGGQGRGQGRGNSGGAL